jgi:hypothetical protein
MNLLRYPSAFGRTNISKIKGQFWGEVVEWKKTVQI